MKSILEIEFGFIDFFMYIDKTKLLVTSIQIQQFRIIGVNI